MCLKITTVPGSSISCDGLLVVGFGVWGLRFGVNSRRKGLLGPVSRVIQTKKRLTDYSQVGLL
jgi:hypothetical protein